jgi:protoporphyrinogen oxidase
MSSTDSKSPSGYDVLIIGSGISGCGAAWYLQKQGRSSLILEANSRSGGKTYTVPDGFRSSGHADLGASWVNDTTQTHINALINELGLDRIQQNIDGLDITQDSDLSFHAHEYTQSVVGTTSPFLLLRPHAEYDLRIDEHRRCFCGLLCQVQRGR